MDEHTLPGIYDVFIGAGALKEKKQFWIDRLEQPLDGHQQDNLLVTPDMLQSLMETPLQPKASKICFIRHTATTVGDHDIFETDVLRFFSRLQASFDQLHSRALDAFTVYSAVERIDGQYEVAGLEFRRITPRNDHEFYASVIFCHSGTAAPENTKRYHTDSYHHWSIAANEVPAFQALAPAMRPPKTLATQCALYVKAGADEIHEWISALVNLSLALCHRVFPCGAQSAPPELCADYVVYKTPGPWLFPPEKKPTGSCMMLGKGFFSVMQLQENPGCSKERFYHDKAALFVFSAASKEGVIQALERFADRADAMDHEAMLTAAKENNLVVHEAYRAAIVASDKKDLLEKLRKTANSIKKSDRSPARIKNNAVWNTTGITGAKVAGVFPGQGAQHIDMLKALCIRFPKVRHWFDHLEAVLVAVNGILPSLTIFPPSDQQDARLLHNLYSQEGGNVAVIVSSNALYELLASFGCEPDVLIGHSSGEISAMLVSQCLRFETKAQLFETILSISQRGARGEARGDIPKGKFLSVTTTDATVLDTFIRSYPDDVFLAMDNCPHQKVLFFPNDNFDHLHAELMRLDVICILLYFDRAYHTSLFEPQMPPIREIYASLEFYEPRIPIFSCVKLDTFQGDARQMREWAALNWTNRVQFQQACQLLAQKGVQVFIEIGPGGMLSGFVDSTLNNTPHKSLPMEQEGRDAYVQFLNILANLFTEGVPVKLDGLYENATVSDTPPAPIPQMETQFVESNQITRPDMPGLVAGSESRRPAGRKAIHRHTKSVLIQEHFALMNAFLASEQRIMQALLAKRKTQAFVGRKNLTATQTANSGQPADVFERSVSLPMIDILMSKGNGVWVCERTISRAKDLFLKHHTFGRHLLGNPTDNEPLPVVPLAMTIETMAEACIAMTPGYVVAEVVNLSALRWMSVEEENLTLCITCKLISKAEDIERRIQVTVTNKEEPEDPYCKAMVILKRQYSTPPAPMAIQAEAPTALLWDAESFFEQCLFHGDAFSSIDELVRLGEQDVELRLRTPHKNMLFSENTAPEFCTPAQLLDVPGHATAYWKVEHGDEFFGVYPVSVDRIQFFAPPPVPGAQFPARASNTLNGSLITTGFEVLQTEETVYMKISGFKMMYYRLELSLLNAHYWTGPNAYFCKELEIPDDAVIGFEANTLNGGFQEQGGGIWVSSLLHMYCNASEKKQWKALPEKGKRRIEWLLGRIAAKEIVRKWAFHRYAVCIVYPAIEIKYDDEGRPFAVCEELDLYGGVPDISITHSNVQAIALATERHLRVGVDMEYLATSTGDDPNDRNQDLALAFDAYEMQLFENSGIDMRLLICAKEAASKAVGVGLLGSLTRWKVRSCLADTVCIEADGVEIAVKLIRTEPTVVGYCTIPVSTAVHLRHEILRV